MAKSKLKPVTYKFIGMKEFRQNLAAYAGKAKKENIKYIILRKNVPILEVSALDEKEIAFAKLGIDLEEARQQVKDGKVHSQEEVLEMFRIK